MTSRQIPALGATAPTPRKTEHLPLCDTLESAVDLALMNAHMTHEMLGDRIGRTRAGVTMYQSRKRRWTVEAIVKVCHSTGSLAPIQWICREVGGELYVDPQEKRKAALRAELRRLEGAA